MRGPKMFAHEENVKEIETGEIPSFDLLSLKPELLSSEDPAQSQRESSW